jgi:diadenosine tetraphosphatase ApaH/serine/threonine PP2A family protein phosphatase
MHTPARTPAILCARAAGGVGLLKTIEELDLILERNTVDLDAPNDTLSAAALHDKRLLEDVLWSDPALHDDDVELQQAGGTRFNEARGIALWFHPDVVRTFCKDNNIGALVRAHEVPADGVELFAGGLGVSVFSAADYPEAAALSERKNNYAALLWMGRDGRLYPRLLPPRPRAAPPPLA